MIEFWTNLSYTTKFSVIAFFATGALGIVSMGFLGLALYFPVSFLFKSYPGHNSWHGDWVWPAVIGVGMFWSFGFLIAGTAWHYLTEHIPSVVVLRIVYGLILYAWAALLWWGVIHNNVG
jgi:hypothetical protein